MNSLRGDFGVSAFIFSYYFNNPCQFIPASTNLVKKTVRFTCVPIMQKYNSVNCDFKKGCSIKCAEFEFSERFVYNID